MRLMSSTCSEGIFTTIRNWFHTFMFCILKSTYLCQSRGYFFKNNYYFLFIAYLRIEVIFFFNLMNEIGILQRKQWKKYFNTINWSVCGRSWWFTDGYANQNLTNSWIVYIEQFVKIYNSQFTCANGARISDSCKSHIV